MKLKGNKLYQFYEDFSTYQERCKETDPLGYDVVFTSMDDPDGRIDIMDSNAREVIDEILDEDEHNIERDEELEYENNDPVKKYQFEYNKSLCMTNKYPEVSANEQDVISVAPGEGKVPKDILSEEDWDIKAFPHLNNPDGSNGKDQEREVRLTDQNYFIQ